MARSRNAKADTRNVMLTIETYDKLDKYLLELMNLKGNRHVTLGDAVAALLDEHRQHMKESGA